MIRGDKNTSDVDLWAEDVCGLIYYTHWHTFGHPEHKLLTNRIVIDSVTVSYIYFADTSLDNSQSQELDTSSQEEPSQEDAPAATEAEMVR